MKTLTKNMNKKTKNNKKKDKKLTKIRISLGN